MNKRNSTSKRKKAPSSKSKLERGEKNSISATKTIYKEDVEIVVNSIEFS